MKVYLISLGLILGSLAAAQNIVAVGTADGRGSHVDLFSDYNLSTGASHAGASFLPYGTSYSGGVRVAVGDVDGDGAADIITSTVDGPGNIKVFDQSGNSKQSFFAYATDFTGGAYVGAGDVNGDGKVDIITGAGAGGGPHVKAFDGFNNTLSSFFAYTPTFAGGVRVAAGDVNGDGIADIITGAGAGAGPHVKVFDGATGTELRSFFAFDAGFSGGITVAAGDVNGDGFADIITGAGAGGGPHVKVFSGQNGSLLSDYFAFSGNFTEGMNVAAGDLNGDGIAEILAGGDTSASGYRIFDQSGNLLNTFAAGAGSTIAVYPSSVPEPGSILAITSGLVILGIRRKRK